MKVYQIGWNNPSAPPSYVVAEDIVDAAKVAHSASTSIQAPADTRGVARVSLVGVLLKAVDCHG